MIWGADLGPSHNPSDWQGLAKTKFGGGSAHSDLWSADIQADRQAQTDRQKARQTYRQSDTETYRDEQIQTGTD